MSEIIKIDLFRQDEPTETEWKAYGRAFFSREIQFSRIDPINYIEHDKACDERQPTLVQLPKDKPIPYLAMKKFPHVIVTPEGKIMKLKSINVEFEPFVPGQ